MILLDNRTECNIVSLTVERVVISTYSDQICQIINYFEVEFQLKHLLNSPFLTVPLSNKPKNFGHFTPYQNNKSGEFGEDVYPDCSSGCFVILIIFVMENSAVGFYIFDYFFPF